MNGFNSFHWERAWLNRPWIIAPVPGTAMLEVNGVAGFLIPGDVAYLFNLAAELPRGGVYLEIGSWLGLSSIVFANGLLAQMNFSARVYCVDTWKGSTEHQELSMVRDGTLYETFIKNVARARMDAFVTPIQGDSTDVATSWSGPVLDMIFIDGDHSAEACYRDLAFWLPHLAPQGRVLGHDCIPGGGVAQALSRFRSESGISYRVKPPPEAHYIWELELPDPQ